MQGFQELQDVSLAKSMATNIVNKLNLASLLI